MPRGISTTRKVTGKALPLVQLHCYINAAQDAELAKLVRSTGRNKSLLVSEAIHNLIVAYKGMGEG